MMNPVFELKNIAKNSDRFREIFLNGKFLSSVMGDADYREVDEIIEIEHLDDLNFDGIALPDK